MNKVIAEAKSLGYKLKVAEVNGSFKYLMYYDGAYFKVGLLEASYGIINDGEEAIVYHDPGSRTPITIKTSLGYCVVMPMHLGSDDIDNYIIINADEVE